MRNVPINWRAGILKAAVACAASALLSGCALSVDAFSVKFYQLPDVSVAEQPASAHQSGVLLAVRDARANPLINSHKILFSSDGVEQGFYQYASWAEPPPKRFTALLISALESSALFDSVTHIANSTLNTFQLNTEILELYHDTMSQPGVTKVKVRIELVETVSRRLAAQKVFSVEKKLDSFDARGAVDATGAAVQQVINDIVLWCASLPRAVFEKQVEQPAVP